MKTIWLIAGPSGSGKTTLVKNLVSLKKVSEVISHTTRKPRQNEEHTRDYFFVSKDYFEMLIACKEMVEWVQVNNNLYGITKTNLLNVLNANDTAIILEPEGISQILEMFPRAKTVYVSPPSDAELAERMLKRGDTIDTIESRYALDTAIKEWGKSSAMYTIAPGSLQDMIEQFVSIQDKVYAANS